jgi:hypothetical protein
MKFALLERLRTKEWNALKTLLIVLINVEATTICAFLNNV